jgi:CHASE3 domain sensor protein
MKRSNFYIGLYLFLVFLSGILVGAIGHRLYSAQVVNATRTASRSSEDYRKHYVEEMSSRLKLRADQVQQLNAVLDQTRKEFHAVREKFEPAMKVVQDEQTTRINAMLDDAQRAEYQRMREERAKRLQQHKGKGYPGF